MVIVTHANCQTVTNLTPEDAFFSTLRLLDFNVYAAEKQHKIKFKPDMFSVPNKKGLEVVLHFLLTSLDPARSKTEFDNSCWPAYDVKRSHVFRKKVFNWLTELNRDYVEGVQIPRINSSTLTKASGPLVVTLLERLSTLVLSTLVSHTSPHHRDEARYCPVFSPSKPHLNMAAAATLHLELQRLRQKIAERGEQTLMLKGMWSKAFKETADETQRLSKKKKKLEMKKDALETRQKDYLTAYTSDKKFIKTLTLADEEALRTDVQQKAAKTKQHLRRFNESSKRRIAERAVINSLVNGDYGQHVVHQDRIALQVPSMILQEYQRKLSEGSIGNTYLGGDLCLVSLTKIAFIGLKMISESLGPDTHKTKLPRSILQHKRELLTHNLETLQNLNMRLLELEEDCREFNVDGWKALPDFTQDHQELRLQSPIPVFSLTPNKDPAVKNKDFLHVSPMTPQTKVQSRSIALTPLSLRKYKRGSRRMSTLATNMELKPNDIIMEDIENQENISLNLRDAFEKTNICAETDTFERRDTVLSRDLNDLSLLDASVNFSFLN